MGKNTGGKGKMAVPFVGRFGIGGMLILLLLSALVPAAAATPISVEVPSPTSQVQSPDADSPFFALEETEILYQPDELHLATGNPGAEHAVYDWPFSPQSMGHAIQSYQYYGGDPYFHHGIDIMAAAGTNVSTRSGGQIVNVENYVPGNSLYWEVAVLDPEGYLWQYHHIDEPTIPQYVWDKWDEYLADPVNGGYVSPGAFIGEIVWWPVGYPGAPENFHHIHLNILGEGGIYLNGLEFHTPLSDPDSPELYEIGLLQNGQIYPGNEIEGEYSLYVHSGDLLMSDLYWLPPYEVTFSIDGGPVTSVWPFDALPGGDDRYAFVTDYYVVPPTCGDYGCNDFYIDIGFIPDDQHEFPSTSGPHTAEVWSYDFAGNETYGSFTWTVTGDASLHIGDLDGRPRLAPNGNWKAIVRITVHDQGHAPLPNAMVTGSWDDGRPGSNSCTTDSAGRCVVFQRLHKSMSNVSFTVDSVELASYVYWPGDNHDPDGDSDGTTISLAKP